MGLTSSLLIGQTALSASQLALQVTGNNLANAATPGYHRQRVDLTTMPGQRVGNTFVGRGVRVQDIQRIVDPALLARVRGSISGEEAVSVELGILDSIESLTNELTGIDLSSELGAFFNAFSEAANNPSSSVTRAAVVEQGASLASFMRRLRGDLLETRTQLEHQLSLSVEQASGLLAEVATLNAAILNGGGGTGGDGNLYDQRDALLTELSRLLEVTVVERESGSVDVLVGSTPVVLAGTSRGIELEVESTPAGLEFEVIVTASRETLPVEGGRIGAQLEQRTASLQSTIDDLDTLAAALIFEVNALHASGRPPGGITDATSWLALPPADQLVALNDPGNQTLAGLPFGPVNGSFQVTVRDANGNASTQTIQVDLDGIDAAGVAGFGDDTTLEDLRAALDAIPNLNAQITSDGRLRVTTDTGYEVSFAEDTSGVLATLGINTLFTGTGAADVAVNEVVRADASMLAVGWSEGTNETALAIAGLREAKLDALSGRSLTEQWQTTVERTAVQSSSAQTRFAALSSVRQSLEAQEAAVSGVSVDEESINLVTYQQQYQGAARFISVVDELTQLLLSLV